VIWVIVDRLTKTAHFIAMRNTWTLDLLARAYLEEIIRLHGIPNSIVLDRALDFYWASDINYRKRWVPYYVSVQLFILPRMDKPNEPSRH